MMETEVTSVTPPRDNAPRKRTKRRLWLSLLGMIVLYALYAWVWVPYRAERLTFRGSSTALKQTVVVPTLDSPLPAGKNVVWCASFQAAWDQLRVASKGIIQQPPTLLGAEGVTRRLNLTPMSTADLPATSYAAAGMVGQGIMPAMQSAMGQRFPGVSLPEFGPLEQRDIIAYAYLESAIHFPIPYLNAPPMNFNGTRVACFGIREKDKYDCHDLRGQVRVLYHNYNDKEYAIDPCQTSDVQMVLASVTPGATLAETVAATEKKITAWANRKDESEKMNRLTAKQDLSDEELQWLVNAQANDPKNDPPELGPRDILLIPNMRWSIDHRFSELEGKSFIASPPTHDLLSARQTISFNFNRSGAGLTSFALMKARAKGGQRTFIYDHPYLLYLRLRGHAHPFFAMWVGNAELLTGM
ncbi:MAG: hypothetical protein ACYDBB_24120 [Armatimonadota bacterium]